MTGYTLPNGGVFYGECGSMQSDPLAQEFLDDILLVTGFTEYSGTVSGIDNVITGKTYTKDGITLKEEYVFMDIGEPTFNPYSHSGVFYEIIE